MTPNPLPHRAGFTLLELLVSSMVTMITGGLAFLFLNTGTVLFAKNTAMNVAHQQARVAIAQMQQDVHAAVSIPRLVDTSGAVVNGASSAAGIEFQLQLGKNLQVNADAAATATQIDVRFSAASLLVDPLVVGQRLIVRTHSIEQDITSWSNQGGGVYQLHFASPIGTAIKLDTTGQNFNVVCLRTKRVSYIIVGGELRFYPLASDSTYRVMANNITNPTPFQIPAGNRAVAVVDLSTNDSSSSRRGYKAANLFLNTQIPYRAHLTKYQ